jgi:hypothetical protein
VNSCISPPKIRAGAEAESDDDSASLTWRSIVEGIRLHARNQPSGVAAELEQWAHFFEGVAQFRGEG